MTVNCLIVKTNCTTLMLNLIFSKQLFLIVFSINALHDSALIVSEAPKQENKIKFSGKFRKA